MISGRLLSSHTLILILLFTGLIACNGEESTHSDQHSHSDDLQRLTYWDNTLELFALFEVHENSGRIEGELFLSDHNQPIQIEDGEVQFIENGSVTAQQNLNKEQKGVYPFELYFGNSDEPDLAVNFRHNSNEYNITLGSVNRYEHIETDYDSNEVVELEKTMQWRISVTTAKAAYYNIPNLVSGTGVVRQNPKHYHEIYSPVDGYIDSGNFHINMAPGSAVTAGQRLFTLSPSLSSENSWTELRLAYNQASQAYERAKRLIQNDAISLREYQEREREYEVRKAGYEQFLNGNGAGTTIEDGGNNLHLIAARDGVIAESHLVSGQEIKQGDLLFSLFNPNHLWIEVLAYRDELNALNEFSGLEILTSRNEWLTLNTPDLTFISRDLRSDATGSRSKVIFSIDNFANKLSMNQPVRVRLAGDESRNVVSIPNEAIFDNESYKVVFVMHSGDQFERRIVQTGYSYDGKTAILDGLNADERVVTNGVYPLHLMTGNVQIDDDHDH